MDFRQCVAKIRDFVPLYLAQSWDNVGLLVEPICTSKVNKLLVTTDLTPGVVREAIAKKAELIVSYHPPIFQPLNTVTKASWKERIISACLSNNIAIYSPHTALDAVNGGITDFMVDAFGKGDVNSIENAASFDDVKIEIDLTGSNSINFEALNLEQFNLVYSQDKCLAQFDRINNKISDNLIRKLMSYGIERERIKMSNTTNLHDPSLPNGAGRILYLKEPISIEKCTELLKKKLGLDYLQLARMKFPSGKISYDHLIKSIAFCPGSGGSLLKSLAGFVDLWVTGELSHHDLLHAIECGTSVILCGHSQSERPFLHGPFIQLMKTLLPCVTVEVATEDMDPFMIV